MTAAPVILRSCHAGLVPDLVSGTLTVIEPLPLAATQWDTESPTLQMGDTVAWDLMGSVARGDEAGKPPLGQLFVWSNRVTTSQC